MRTGNLSEPVWKRSVFRQLNMEIYGSNGHYGADCTAWCSPETGQADTAGTCGPVCGMTVSASSGAIPGFEREPWRQVTAVVNALAAGAAQPYGLIIHAILPVDYEEPSLQADMKQISAAACRHRMDVLDACMQVSADVSVPQYILTGIGTKLPSGAGSCGTRTGADADTAAGDMTQEILRPGQELIVTKWIALAGTAALAFRYEGELCRRYPFSLIDRAKEFEKLLGVEDEARAITHFGSCAVHNLTQGGIFNALWEMAERAGVGLEVDLKKIPVKQETIEICEHFDINPYYLSSAGALLAGTEHAEELIARLAAMGVPAAVIGRVTDGRERVILNGEERRYLDRPQQDEWYRKLDR